MSKIVTAGMHNDFDPAELQEMHGLTEKEADLVYNLIYEVVLTIEVFEDTAVIVGIQPS